MSTAISNVAESRTISLHPPTSQLEELRIPTSATTLEGFRDWFASSRFPERVRASLIGGELILESSMEDLRMRLLRSLRWTSGAITRTGAPIQDRSVTA